MKSYYLYLVFMGLVSATAGAKDFQYNLPLFVNNQPAQVLTVQENQLSSSNRFYFNFTPSRNGYVQVMNQFYHIGGTSNAQILDLTDGSKPLVVAEDITGIVKDPTPVVKDHKYALVLTQESNVNQNGYFSMWGAFGFSAQETARLNLHSLCETQDGGHVWVSPFGMGSANSPHVTPYYENEAVPKRLEYFNCKPFVRDYKFYTESAL